VVSTYVDHPIGSMSGGDPVSDCYLGCTANWGCSWGLGTNAWQVLSGYLKFDTVWAERHTEHHRCDDGYEYDDVYGYVHETDCWLYDRNCWQDKFDDWCTHNDPYSEYGYCTYPPHQDLNGSGDCFIDPTRQWVKFGDPWS
jgi:hypothetical protein